MEDTRTPPSDIHIEVNGVTYRLDSRLDYLGYIDGFHQWRAYGPPHERFRRSQLRASIGTLPPRTIFKVPIAATGTPGVYTFQQGG